VERTDKERKTGNRGTPSRVVLGGKNLISLGHAFEKMGANTVEGSRRPNRGTKEIEALFRAGPALDR